jgi:hypothetical protein
VQRLVPRSVWRRTGEDGGNGEDASDDRGAKAVNVCAYVDSA